SKRTSPSTTFRSSRSRSLPALPLATAAGFIPSSLSHSRERRAPRAVRSQQRPQPAEAPELLRDVEQLDDQRPAEVHPAERAEDAAEVDRPLPDRHVLVHAPPVVGELDGVDAVAEGPDERQGPARQ